MIIFPMFKITVQNLNTFLGGNETTSKSKNKDGTRAPEVFLRRPFLALFLSRNAAPDSVAVTGLSKWPRKHEIVSGLPSGSLTPIE